jgi:predicted glutamine amidotransferase
MRVCLAHSGVVEKIDNVNSKLENIANKDIPNMIQSIEELKIFMAKLTGGIFILYLIIDKIFLK